MVITTLIPTDINQQLFHPSFLYFGEGRIQKTRKVLVRLLQIFVQERLDGQYGNIPLFKTQPQIFIGSVEKGGWRAPHVFERVRVQGGRLDGAAGQYIADLKFVRSAK